MNKLDRDYQKILNNILEQGHTKNDRTGTGVISLFGTEIRHQMSDGFPLLTTKKMYLKGVVAELIWFLRGDTNIKFLVDNNCNIWVGDCYKAYYNKVSSYRPETIKTIVSEEDYWKWGHFLKTNDTWSFRPYTIDEFLNLLKTRDEFCSEWGELGKIYSHQWRNWGGYTSKRREEFYMGGSFGGSTSIRYGDLITTTVKGIDQISNLINTLKTDPDSRRLMVNAWNVSDLNDCVLPPCHFNFECYTRELSIEERLGLLHELESWDKGLNISDTTLVRVCDEYNIPKRALSLKWSQRSADTPLGMPYNIASYGLLLLILSRMCNMQPDVLIGSFGNTHIYQNQKDGVIEQLSRGPYELPKLTLSSEFDWGGSDIDTVVDYLIENINTFYSLENYKSHPTIKFPLSN